MTRRLFIDCETQCDVDLPRRGAYVYFDSLFADVYTLSYAFTDDDDDGHLVRGRWVKENPCPREISEHVSAGCPVVAHNAEFEFLAWNEVLVPHYGWPSLRIDQLECTATIARACGLPGSLELAIECLELDMKKDPATHRLMLEVCKPYAYDQETPLFHKVNGERLKKLQKRCDLDVLMSLALFYGLPKVDPSVFQTNLRVNLRGICIDTDFASRAQRRARQLTYKSGRDVSGLSMGEIDNVTQVTKLKAWINANSSLALTNISQSTLEGITPDDVSPEVWNVIQARLNGRAAAIGKYKNALLGVSNANRFRGAFVPFGAPTTGRYSSRRLQVHNFRRDSMDDAEFAKFDIESAQLEDIARNVRRMIVAPPGCALVVADWAQVEARIAPWLAGEQRMVELFAIADRVGDDWDLYTHVARTMFPNSEMTAELRFLGKVAQLALTYEGGINALNNMLHNFGRAPLSAEEGTEIVSKWRVANMWAVNAWRQLHVAVKRVLRLGAKEKVCRCVFTYKAPFLRCELPSGRHLYYPFAAFDQCGDVVYKKATVRPKADESTWPQTSLYGGKLLENICQAVCADLLMSILHRHNNTLNVVSHKHDDIIAEVPMGDADRVAQLLEHAMSAPPDWAPDLPLRADAKIMTRYQ